MHQGFSDRFLAICSLIDDFKSGLARQKGAQPDADDLVIVDDDDSQPAHDLFRAAARLVQLQHNRGAFSRISLDSQLAAEDAGALAHVAQAATDLTYGR
jgi:hypothetical protein